MKRMKKFLAVLTAATLLATPFTALAADSNSGSVDSDSYLEGVTPDDVFSVQLPTIPANTYKIVLDPDKLLSTVATNKSASQNSYDPDATLLFGNASGDYEHSNTSDGASVVNVSMKDAVLTVNVTVTNAKTNPVTFVGSEAAVSANTTTNVYLAVVPGAKGTVSDNAVATVSANDPVTAQASAVDTSGKASMSFYIPGQPDNFELDQQDDASTRSGHKYLYTKKAADELAAWNTASFYLTGASNPNADWKKFNEKSQLIDDATAENLKVKTVWSVAAATDAQKAETPDATTGIISGAGFTPTNTFTKYQESNYYFAPEYEAAELTSIKLFAYDDYAADPASATKVGTVTVKSETASKINAKGNIVIYISAINSSLSSANAESGTYIAEVKAKDGDGVSHTYTASFEYTAQ